MAITCATDRACLEGWRRDRTTEHLRPLVERYAGLVYSSAYRRTGNADRAGEVTHAAFLVLARRARKLRKSTVLAGWLFQVTAIACRKVPGQKRRPFWPRWFRREPRNELAPEATLWTRVAPELDGALERLPAAKRNAVLLRVLLNRGLESVAGTLRTNELRAGKLLDRGLRKLAGRLRRKGVPADPEALAQVLQTEGREAPLPDGLAADILASMEAAGGKRPALKLARRTLDSLAWARWRRRLAVGISIDVLATALVVGVVWYLSSLTGHSRLISLFGVWGVRFHAHRLAEPVGPWPTSAATPRFDAGLVRNAQDLYRTTNIWLAHLDFSREQWKALEAKYIGSMPNFVRPDGMWTLRNPQAQRGGVIGVLGYQFDWTHADLELGGVTFTNVAARAKGNIVSLCYPKRAYKVDLNRFAKGQKLAGQDELVLNNLAWDYSCLGEALAYELFRDAGVPAPRTAYAWLTASVAGQWDRKPLGLYLLLEPVGRAFAAERFGSRTTPVFKPVTYDLFKHLGDDWPAYATIYDLKTTATPQQQRRVIELARLVSFATDAEFAARIGDYLDLDAFARFLASQVLLSSYDSILANGHNFYLYLDPRSNKFGFVPWDLDSAWGDFWIATKPELERASIWHPWTGENRFIERVMAVEEFRRRYRAHLEDFLVRLFVPERLSRRIDELAPILRDPVAAESATGLNKFDRAVSAKPFVPLPGEVPNRLNHPPHQIKRFVEARARSVRQQLDGKSKGMIVKPPRLKQ
jgi:spore coat protein CotH/DNA-directed RNA polymerase specialized sigma24 family protein